MMRRQTMALLLSVSLTTVLLNTGIVDDVATEEPAYNPPCALTPYATCPLPPRQNRLELVVLAGEKKYVGGVEH